MNKNTLLHKLILVVLLGLLYPVELDAKEKTLQRIDDPVVIECVNMKPLWGSSIDQLALMALQKGSWTPVPFQVDQKKPDGTYAFTNGPEASKDPDPSLDANDELVFMAKDTGASIENGIPAFPDGVLTGVEIEVSDPKTGAKGWLYLMRFNGKAPRSDKDYIRIEVDSSQQRIQYITEEYVMGMPNGSGMPDYFAVIRPDGSLGPDMLDQVKIHLEIIFPVIGNRLDFRVDKLFKSTNRAWIDGPVRVMTLNVGYLQITQNIRFRMGGSMIIRLYPNYMESPLRMEPPEESSVSTKIVPQANEYVFIDFTSSVYGARFFSKVSSESNDVVFDGQMSEAEKSLDRQTACDWMAMYSPGKGGIVSRVFVDPPPSSEGLLPRLYFKDDKTINDKPEQEQGISGMGFALYNVDKAVDEMSKANTSAVITTTIYYKNDFNPKLINNVLDIHDHPLVVKIRTLKLPRGE